MLDTVKGYIASTKDIPFAEYYMNYICAVQDQNILAEIKGIKTEEITSLGKLMSLLKSGAGR